jgi:hypothetical protein
VVRELTPQEIERNLYAAAIYVQRAKAFSAGLTLPPTYLPTSQANSGDSQ